MAPGLFNPGSEEQERPRQPHRQNADGTALAPGSRSFWHPSGVQRRKGDGPGFTSGGRCDESSELRAGLLVGCNRSK